MNRTDAICGVCQNNEAVPCPDSAQSPEPPANWLALTAILEHAMREHAERQRLASEEAANAMSAWTCSYCHAEFDTPGGETFCPACWDWVTEIRAYRAEQLQRQAAIDARHRAERLALAMKTES